MLGAATYTFQGDVVQPTIIILPGSNYFLFSIERARDTPPLCSGSQSQN